MALSREQSHLRTTAVVFVGAFLLHNGDHARRGIDAVTDEVIWGGTVVAILAAVTLTLVFTRHPQAAAAATAAGFGIAVGVSMTHLLPDWGALSDSLPSGDVDAFTWIAVLAEVLAAVGLGVAGLQAWRAEQPVITTH
jgi:hypothetical protein